MPSAQRPSDATTAELTEVDLLMRLARRWRRLGADEAERGEGSAQALSPHQERALLALARLSRGSAEHPGHPEGGSAEHLTVPGDLPEEQAGTAGVRVSRLATHLGIAPRSATEVADALEAAGLLARSPDPSDRRAVLLSLTERGLHTVRVVRDRRRAAADRAVASLSPEDRAELRRLLLALLDA